MRYQEILEACWTGYRQAGMKKKGGRMVPNCVPVEEVKTGPEMTLNDLLYTAAAKAMHQAGLEGQPMDYEEAIKKAAKIYLIPYTPSELPKLLAQRNEIDRKLAMLKQGKQIAKARRQEKLAPTPSGAEEYWRTHALPTDRIKPPAKTLEETETELAEDLRKWFKEKWVRFGPDGKIRGACARGNKSEGKPKCLPQSKAHALGKKGRASAAAKKRREDPNPERRGAAKNVATKVKEMDKSQTPPSRHGDYPIGAKGTNVKTTTKKKVVKDMTKELERALAKEKKVKEDSNPKFAALIKNIQARMKKDDYQRPEIIKRVAQMVQQADPTVPDAMATARELVQQHGQGPVEKQTNVWDLKAQARSGNLAAQLPKTSAGTPSYAQQHATFEEQSTNNDDWYDDADEFGMPGSEFFPDEDDRLRDGDYVRDRQDGEYGEIFRMSGDPTERRVRILDRDGKGWYISPERLVAVDRNDPDIMKYFGKRRQRDMDEGAVADSLENYLQVTGENDVEAVKTAIQKIARDPSLKPTAKARLLGQVGMMIKTHKLPVGREYYQYMQQFMEDQLNEKQDACYRKVKSRYKVWPSAYASGALVQCRKKGAANWGTGAKKK